jgi:hypothetical protein
VGRALTERSRAQISWPQQPNQGSLQQLGWLGCCSPALCWQGCLPWLLRRISLGCWWHQTPSEGECGRSRCMRGWRGPPATPPWQQHLKDPAISENTAEADLCEESLEVNRRAAQEAQAAGTPCLDKINMTDQARYRRTSPRVSKAPESLCPGFSPPPPSPAGPTHPEGHNSGLRLRHQHRFQVGKHAAQPGVVRMEVHWTGGGGHVVEESGQHFISDGIRVGEVPAEQSEQAVHKRPQQRHAM